jgi:flagellar biosynthesis anti-sigma factor FlgM
MRINMVTQPLNSELRKVEGAKKAEKENKNGKLSSTDRSEISSGAQHLSETNAQFETIAASISAQPEIRTEKIAEIKSKIENGYYNSDDFIDKLADKLLNEFGVK